MISFIQASGSAFMSVRILKEGFKDGDIAAAEFETEGSFYYLRGQIRRRYAWNETGRLNSELFANIIDIFMKRGEKSILECIL